MSSDYKLGTKCGRYPARSQLKNKVWWSLDHRSHGELEMKFPRFPRSTPHVRSAKSIPFFIISLFVFFNFTNLGLSPVMAPVANAAEVEAIPADIPLSGDCDLDWIIYRAGQKFGVDPRFIHWVIKQESKYNVKAISPGRGQGPMQMMPATAEGV